MMSIYIFFLYFRIWAKKAFRQAITQQFIFLSDLEQENLKLSDEIRSLKDERMCKICLSSEFNVVFVPCGHQVSCNCCARSLKVCPICRKNIEKYIKTYMS